MGTLRSTQDCTGVTVNGATLGNPIELDDDPTTFEWDDSAFPNGVVSVTVTEPDEDDEFGVAVTTVTVVADEVDLPG
jgi:hypothetical protein